jgi:type I restriction enzyme, R subunit
LKVPPLSELGTPFEIANRFGGPDKLLAAIDRLQEFLYAA